MLSTKKQLSKLYQLTYQEIIKLDAQIRVMPRINMTKKQERDLFILTEKSLLLMGLLNAAEEA